MAQSLALLPTYKPAPYNWNLDLNNRKQAKKIIAVKPLSGASFAGPLRTIAIDQEFSVILSDVYNNKGDNDQDLNDKIYAIYEDIETLYKNLMLRKLNISTVLGVLIVDIKEPNINEEEKYLSVEATFSVKYKKDII
jgi:hypothetical protein